VSETVFKTLDFDWQPRDLWKNNVPSHVIVISLLSSSDFPVEQLTSMPRQQVDPEQAKLKRQQRNQRYRRNVEATERNRERNTLYQQKKREQARLQQHQDPLAQLADVATQREYLDEENDVSIEAMEIEPVGEGEDLIDVSGMVEEDGEVLENLSAGAWEEEFNDGWGHGFHDDFSTDINENGMECLEITNGRGQYQGRGTEER